MKKGIKKILLKILQLFPTKVQIQIEYLFHLKRLPNLKKPVRFTEKLQIYKYKYKNPNMIIAADKVRVREYVKKLGFGHILNEIYGTYERVEDIDYEILPQKFVIKLNTGSGKNIFVEDKNKLDIQSTNKILKKWLKIKRSSFRTEWMYKHIKPHIIIEKYLERDKNNDIPDYKFFGFDGVVEYLYVMKDYIDDHSRGRLSFFDRNFVKTKFHRKDYEPILEQVAKPDNFDEMINISQKLSKGFAHARVDLYNIDGKIIFGELTFFTNMGYINFVPDEFDYILGEKFKMI